MFTMLKEQRLNIEGTSQLGNILGGCISPAVELMPTIPEAKHFIQ